MRGMSSIAGAAARRACSAGLARGGARRSEAVKAVPTMSAIAIPTRRGGVNMRTLSEKQKTVNLIKITYTQKTN